MATVYEHGSVYWGRVTKQQMGKAESSGNPQFVLSFIIMGKVNPLDPKGDLLSCPSQERTIYRVITDKTIDYALEDLQALCDARGITPYPTSFRQVDPNRPEFNCDFVGTEIGFYCKHDTYQGKTKEKWQVSRGSGGASAGDPMDDKEMRQLDALFAKKMGGGKAPAKAPPRRTKTEAGMAAQAPLNAPADDGPDPWDKDDAKAKEANRKLAEAAAPDDNIPF